MQNVEYLIAFFLNRWTTSFVGVGMAGMIVWYLGPLVPGFESPLMRCPGCHSDKCATANLQLTNYLDSLTDYLFTLRNALDDC